MHPILFLTLCDCIFDPAEYRRLDLWRKSTSSEEQKLFQGIKAHFLQPFNIWCPLKGLLATGLFKYA